MKVLFGLFGLLCASPALSTYEVVQVVTATGGTRIDVAAGAGLVNVPGLTLSITLLNANDGVSCYWSMPVQSDAAGAALIETLTRGGVIIGKKLPFAGATGSMTTLGTLADDRPGYIGPLAYTVSVGANTGGGHAPADWGGGGSITCDEVVLP